MTEMSSAANVAAVGTTGFKAPGTTPQKTPRGAPVGVARIADSPSTSITAATLSPACAATGRPSTVT